MIKKILVALAVAVVGIAVVVALQPTEFRVVRSASIAAPPAVVFGYVNDLHKWQEFSPWAKRDPAAKNTFEGPPAGAGAIFSWAGNAEVGEGRMTITESRPDERVRMRLDFFKPIAATNAVEFTFEPEGEQTVVTWSMSGENGFVGKAIGLLMNMDEMVGGDFEKGLADLKSLSEAAAKGWPATSVLDLPSSDDGRDHADVLDLLRIDVQRMGVEDREIRVLSGLERAGFLLHPQEPGGASSAVSF